MLLKALLVHGAGWGQGSAILEAALRKGSNDPKVKTRIASFLGYGIADLDRALECTKQRATLIGCDSIREDEGHEYSIPLPPSLRPDVEGAAGLIGGGSRSPWRG